MGFYLVLSKHDHGGMQLLGVSAFACGFAKTRFKTETQWLLCCLCALRGICRQGAVQCHEGGGAQMFWARNREEKTMNRYSDRTSRCVDPWRKTHENLTVFCLRISTILPVDLRISEETYSENQLQYLLRFLDWMTRGHLAGTTSQIS